jgi:hypothetical protein
LNTGDESRNKRNEEKIMKANEKNIVLDYGRMPSRDLYDYVTGECIRSATAEEARKSDAEVAAGHYEGLIVVDGRTCYVE